MKSFLIALIVALALTVFGQVVHLAAGRIPQRAPATVAFDIFVNTAFSYGRSFCLGGRFEPHRTKCGT
ncbi:hypothetical protein [Burkholderia gladioli]|uniref:hypothetical protein n=1 Tax=Burkholderia gladioli TaxID=28095 RepID=UPI003B9850A2